MFGVSHALFAEGSINLLITGKERIPPGVTQQATLVPSKRSQPCLSPVFRDLGSHPVAGVGTTKEPGPGASLAGAVPARVAQEEGDLAVISSRG